MKQLNDFLHRWKINLASLDSILRKKILFAAWHVTYRCNLRCRFCDFYQRPTERELTPKEFATGATKLVNLGVRVFNFAGGEPFIRKDICDIVSGVSPFSIVIINTNGTLITPQKARECWEAGTDVVNVSIDFANSEQHDWYRDKKGTYEKAWNAIDFLKNTRTSSRQIVTAQAIYSPENHEQMQDMLERCQSNGITFAMNPYSPMGEHREKFSWENLGVAQQLRKLKNQFPKTFLITDYAIKCTEKYIQQKGMIDGCCAGKHMLALTPEGHILPCERQIDRSVGTVVTMSTEEIHSAIKKEFKSVGCNQCYARERSELEYIYQPFTLSRFLYMLSEAKT